MDFSTMLILFVVGVVIVAFIGRSMASAELEARTGNLKAVPNFNSDKFHFGDKTGIAFDESKYQVNLIQINGDNSLISRIISYRDILSVEIFEDGDSTTKTSRTSQAGGALVGGVLLGGVGLLVGGLSGKQVTTTKVTRVDLRIVVNDVKNPLHDVNFLKLESPRNGILYEQASSKARNWLGTLEVLIRKADDEDKVLVQPITSTVSNTSSFADELKKLAELRQAGLLTDEEFQSQKAKLLA